MNVDERWRREYARRRAIAQAVLLSPDVDSYQANANAFILGLDVKYLTELSQYLRVETPYGVLGAMKRPGFLREKRGGIVIRLAAWGWDPFESVNFRPGRTRWRGPDDLSR